MKKIIYFVVAAALFCGCEKENDTENNVVDGIGSIYGVITDKATGDPVRAAGVQLRPTGLTTVTGDDGYYEFLDLEDGNYSLTVSKTGYTDLIDDYNIIVKNGKSAHRDAQIAKLPSSLSVVNDSQQEISELDFGSNDNITSTSFSIFNTTAVTLNWSITGTSDWITSISIKNGTLPAGNVVAITITIDREKLEAGDNTTRIYVTSNSGNKELTVRATGKRITPEVATLPIGGSAQYYFPAVFNGSVIVVGKPAYSKRGFCFSTSNTRPTITNNSVKIEIGYGLWFKPPTSSYTTAYFEVSGTGEGEYNAAFSDTDDFSMATITYYVRAWVQYEDEIIYGSVQSFTLFDI